MFLTAIEKDQVAILIDRELPKIKDATHHNDHMGAGIIIAELLRMTAAKTTLEALRSVHTKLGFNPDELLQFRDSIIRGMCDQAGELFGSKTREKLRSAL